jgi:hypothetical protein
MTLDGDDYRAFLEKVGDDVAEEFNEELFGHDAHRQIELPDSIAKVELHHLLSALITAHNHASDNGDFYDCVMYHALITEFAELDEELYREFEEAQKRDHSLTAVLGMAGGQV